MRSKLKNFYMAPYDIEWIKKIRLKAKKGRIGNVSLSEVLADLIDFARSNGYEYQDWQDQIS